MITLTLAALRQWETGSYLVLSVCANRHRCSKCWDRDCGCRAGILELLLLRLDFHDLLNGHVYTESFFWSEKVVVVVGAYINLGPPHLARELVSSYAEVFVDWSTALVPDLCH